MKIDEAIKYMKQVIDIEELARILEARETFRQVYVWLTEAFIATGVEQFLDLRDICKKGGESCNAELRAIYSRKGVELGGGIKEDEFDEILKRHA